MNADVLVAPASGAPLERRIALDQIEALFAAITVSVCGGAVAAGVLVAALRRLDAAFFTANGFISVALFVFTVLDVYL